MKKWYLEYMVFNDFENEIGSARTLKSKELKSISEKEATKEGKKLWLEISKKQYTGWDKEQYPNSPCIVYRIPLT